MFGLDQEIARLGGGGLIVALAVAVLLGLRHATDPDHLTAVSTLVVADRTRGARRAGALGLCWGLGHATTLFLFGLPIVLFRRFLPEPVERAAEVAIGLVIVALAVRLLVRWRRGVLHAHPHSHGDLVHAHYHVHDDDREHAHANGERYRESRTTLDESEGRTGGRSPQAAHEAAPAHRPAPARQAAPAHRHTHLEGIGRSPMAAFAIGLLHGVGGSAGAGVLLVAAVPGQTQGIIALALFSGATAISMAALSTAFGHALTRGRAARRLEAFAPAFALFGILFGAWYALGALGKLPYGL